MKVMIEFLHGRKKRSNQHVGVVVAIGPGQVGYSRCRSDEPFNKELGISIATIRAIDPLNPLYPITEHPSRKVRKVLKRVSEKSMSDKVRWEKSLPPESPDA